VLVVSLVPHAPQKRAIPIGRQNTDSVYGACQLGHTAYKYPTNEVLLRMDQQKPVEQVE